MRHGKRMTAGIGCVVMLMLLWGCVSGSPRSFTRRDTDLAAVRKIAVLPFESHTTDDYAGEKIRRVVITELLNRGYEVVEPGEVSRILVEMNRALRILNTEDLRKIGTAVGADAVLLGSVGAYRISPGLTVAYPEVSVHMRLFDVSSGLIVWSLEHNSGGPDFWTRHFGTDGPSLTQTAARVVRESIDSLAAHRSGG